MPTKEDCFSFNVGDIYEYIEFHDDRRWPSPNIFMKDSIEEIIDEYSYRIIRSTRAIYYTYYTPEPVEYTFEKQIIDSRNKKIPYVDQYPPGLDLENVLISESYDSIFKRTIRTIKTKRHYLQNDTLYILRMAPSFESTWEIGENIGIKLYKLYDQEPSNSWYILLKGSVIKNDTLGSIRWNKLFQQDNMAADSIISLIDGYWQSDTNKNHWLKFSKEGYKYHCTVLYNGTLTIDEFDYFAVYDVSNSSWVFRKMDGTEFATKNNYSDFLSCLLETSFYSNYSKKSDYNGKIDTYADSLFTIYYNPKTGLTVIGKNENNPNIQVSIYNIEGKCLDVIERSENPCSIELNGITKGIYLIRIINEDKAFVKKVYIQ